jgi:lipopolysaccharide assembly protein A
MRIVYAAILLVFVLAVVVFCIQNLESVAIAFFGWRISLPLPLLVLTIYVLGMVSGWGLLSFLRRSLRRATESKSKQTKH